MYNEIEKLKSGYFAQEVVKALPDQVKSELSSKVGIAAQIIEKLSKGIKILLSNGMVWGDKGAPGKEPEFVPNAYDPKRLLGEMQSRMEFNFDYGTSVLNMKVKTFKKEAGQDLIQKYMDVWVDKNLEQNKKEAKAISDFAMKQKK